MASDHGSTPAAWTTVALVVVGFVVGAFALVVGATAWVVVGGGIVVAGGIVGKVMQLMGLGRRTYAPASLPAEESTPAARMEPERVR